MSDPDDETPAHETATADLTSSSFLSRRLQAFGSPDLEVVLGREERVFHFHSLILASQSLYVDTLLSSPAARKEQEKHRITFPDIEVATWEKMMKFIAPGSVACPTIEDLFEIIPLYDKYQFMDALDFCDAVVSEIIDPDDDFFSRKVMRSCSDSEKLPSLIAMIWPLNFFPRSKPIAAKWATFCLRKFHSIDEEMMRTLLPLVENDSALVKTMVSTYLGRMCKGMSMNEMRDLIREPEFPQKCIVRCKEISHIDEQIKLQNILQLSVRGWGMKGVSGEYSRRSSRELYKEYDSEFAVSHEGGATRFYWEKERCRIDPGAISVTIESVDVFGSVWEVFTLQSSEDESAGKSRRVCFAGKMGYTIAWLHRSMAGKQSTKISLSSKNK